MSIIRADECPCATPDGPHLRTDCPFYGEDPAMTTNETAEARARIERLTSTQIKALWTKHGGRQHGPITETYTIEEQAFYRFAADICETTLAIQKLTRHAQGGEWITVPRAELQSLLDVADHVPKKTPAAGGCSTVHNVPIEAGVMWSLDQKVAEMRMRLLSAIPDASPGSPSAPTAERLMSALERAESDLHLVTLHGDVVGMHREAMAAKKRVHAALSDAGEGSGVAAPASMAGSGEDHGLGPDAVTIDGAGFHDVHVLVGSLLILKQDGATICLPAARAANLAKALAAPALQAGEEPSDA